MAKSDHYITANDHRDVWAGAANTLTEKAKNPKLSASSRELLSALAIFAGSVSAGYHKLT